ncbi:DUF1223 domain-containing protein [Caulobacter hibisci]|uniref:DUF1223 domain-containing protein n=1 Tax=Caulobacter hibisci TaxID=2035993 RepID=A0ABS0SV51_9CAUL|nr:DUF1223 domain-containing protein [Caulobacter hibisci]MBI1683522.1 DUF1223 domain-containing protein [Caulobacter hibisci]
MRTALISLVSLVLTSVVAAPAAAKSPMLVELFTSQGCSSCGKANQVAADLAEREDVLALTYSVDYWDYLGWKDTFAKPAFAERQRVYAKAFALRDVPTPQVVVAGKVQASGAKAETVEKLIESTTRPPAPDMEFVGTNRVAVGSGQAPRGGGEVWLVRFDPHKQEIAVKRGDNRGQTIVHRNVVRELVKLGPWSGRAKIYRLPAATDEDLATAVIVQGAKGGRVLGVLPPGGKSR